ncbi:MAG: rod-binding protein [Pseudomonadota bacterium]|uniref:rod-binding protein n=1 Tax=Gallaecimonas pentaromativorans TaxID=584787 RepID=UPI0018DC26EE|nr:rod-binding protein [Gallaecimonas pentaromativorans]MED5526541.1 rod-binding protein [Pseudomonadota bacterium]
MNSINATDSHFYQDTTSLRNLKGKEGLEAASGEFEAMFLQMVLKEMRQANQALADEDSLFNSRQQQFYQSMADSQMALDMSHKANIGIADAMTRQLGGKVTDNASEVTAALKNSEASVASGSISTAALRQPLIRTGDGN